VIDCFHLARDLGFDNINMDFIAGLKGDTLDGFKRTMETALALAPENITVHTLSVKRSSNLYQDAESLKMIRDNPTSAMADYSQQALEAAGYHPYYLYRQKNTFKILRTWGSASRGMKDFTIFTSWKSSRRFWLLGQAP
jgi:oxygen-independent coproporphyrinogen-3 oxidase